MNKYSGIPRNANATISDPFNLPKTRINGIPFVVSTPEERLKVTASIGDSVIQLSPPAIYAYSESVWNLVGQPADGTGSGGSSPTLYASDISNDSNASGSTVRDALTLLQSTKSSTESDILEVSQSLSSKQDELVSGTNIKTINGSTLLGSGDFVISGGGSDGWIWIDDGSGDIFVAESNKKYFIAYIDAESMQFPLSPADGDTIEIYNDSGNPITLVTGDNYDIYRNSDDSSSDYNDPNYEYPFEDIYAKFVYIDDYGRWYFVENPASSTSISSNSITDDSDYGNGQPLTDTLHTLGNDVTSLVNEQYGDSIAVLSESISSLNTSTSSFLSSNTIPTDVFGTLYQSNGSGSLVSLYSGPSRVIVSGETVYGLDGVYENAISYDGYSTFETKSNREITLRYVNSNNSIYVLTGSGFTVLYTRNYVNDTMNDQESSNVPGMDIYFVTSSLKDTLSYIENKLIPIGGHIDGGLQNQKIPLITKIAEGEEYSNFVSASFLNEIYTGYGVRIVDPVNKEYHPHRQDSNGRLILGKTSFDSQRIVFDNPYENYVEASGSYVIVYQGNTKTYAFELSSSFSVESLFTECFEFDTDESPIGSSTGAYGKPSTSKTLGSILNNMVPLGAPSNVENSQITNLLLDYDFDIDQKRILWPNSYGLTEDEPLLEFGSGLSGYNSEGNSWGNITEGYFNDQNGSGSINFANRKLYSASAEGYSEVVDYQNKRLIDDWKVYRDSADEIITSLIDTAPTSTSASGFPGQMAYDNTYQYFYQGDGETHKWVRIAYDESF